MWEPWAARLPLAQVCPVCKPILCWLSRALTADGTVLVSATHL